MPLSAFAKCSKRVTPLVGRAGEGARARLVVPAIGGGARVSIRTRRRRPMNPNIRLGTPEKRRRQTRMARHASRLADLREFTDQLFERDRIFPDPYAGAVCASAGLASTPTARAATDFTIMRVLHSPAGCRHAQLNRMRPHLFPKLQRESAFFWRKLHNDLRNFRGRRLRSNPKCDRSLAIGTKITQPGC